MQNLGTVTQYLFLKEVYSKNYKDLFYVPNWYQYIQEEYNTAYYGSTLPNYITHEPPNHGVISEVDFSE